MMKRKLMLAVFSTFLLAACQNSQMGMDKMDMKATTEEMGKMSEQKTENKDSMNGTMGMDEVSGYTFKTLDGKEVSLADYKGKKIYLKFWASWCQPCLKSLPHTEKLAKEEKGFVTLTVVAPGFGGEKPLDQFKSWYAKQGYKHMPVLLDEGGKITARYNVRSYPTNAFVNSKGELHEMIPGAMTEEQIKDVMKDVK